ncbi:hypothetical protein FRC01_010792 [Tulasnella sp. 417]|nr:hypothetical protein FRC01_010792 [Tulasnella sp. 417]
MSTTNAFNTQSQDATTGKQQQQQQQQQPGYIEQAYNLASNAYNSMTSPTDPTTNYRNQQPHVGGVGDLGTKSDADVTRLPEERANPNPYTSGGTSESLSNPNIANPTSIQERLNARDPPNPYPEGNAGVGHSSDKQFRNQQDHVGGVGDLGTKSDADVARLPEERANPDPLASRPGDSNPFKDTTTGAATGFAASHDVDRDRDRHDRDAMDINRPQSHGWKPEQKSWDTGNVVGTMHDPTKHGHSGGVTGSNLDTDHGLGMPHRDDTQRGNRDEGAIGQQTNLAGATDFQSGRDAGFKADTRDPGVNERTQAPVGVDATTTGPRHHDHRDKAEERHHGDDVDMPHRDDTQRGNRDEGAIGQRTNLAGATDFQSGRDAGFKADTRDHGVNERTQAPVGVDTATTGPRHHDHHDEAEERHHEDDTTSPTGKTHPSKLDKLHGKIMVAKGKLTKDSEAIAQGERLQTEGVTIRASDILAERKE